MFNLNIVIKDNMYDAIISDYRDRWSSNCLEPVWEFIVAAKDILQYCQSNDRIQEFDIAINWETLNRSF
jgi:hypothetical protein